MFLHVGMEIVKLVFLGGFQNIEAKIFVLHFKIYLKITENFLLVGDRRRLKGATDADQNPFLQKCASHRLYNVYIYMYNCTVIGELRLEVIVDLRLASNRNLGRVSTKRIFT